MADWLVVVERSAVGALPTVRRYVGGFTSTVLSAGFGTSPGVGEGDDSVCQRNGAIQTDADTAYAVIHDGLYRSTDGGATFPTQVVAFTNPNTTLDDALGHGGVYPIFDAGNNTVYLAGWFKNTADALVGWRYEISTDTAAETTGPATGASTDILACEYMIGDTIHFLMDGNLGPYSWNPVTQSWATLTVGGASFSNSSDMCVGPDGLLYMVWIGASVTRLAVLQGAWSIVGNYGIAEPASFNARTQNRLGIFSDGTDLYAFFMDENLGTNGWRILQIPAPFDLTGVVAVGPATLPASLRSSADGGTATGTGDKRVMIIQDTQSTPGTLRTFFAFSNDATPGTVWAVWEWQGPATPMIFTGMGGAVRDSMPTFAFAGGGRFFTPSQDGVRIIDVSPGVGGELVSFIASGGGTVDVQFRRAEDQQGTVLLATLIGSATGGGTRVGNQVQGVTADGVQVNTIVWDFAADSFSSNEALVPLVPETV